MRKIQITNTILYTSNKSEIGVNNFFLYLIHLFGVQSVSLILTLSGLTC